MLTQDNEKTKKKFILEDIKRAGHSDIKRSMVADKWGLEEDKIRGFDDDGAYQRGQQVEL